MHKKFEINWTKIKGGCQLGRQVVTHNSKNDLPPGIFFKNWQECAEGQYVEKMQWRYQGQTYGLMDFRLKCSDSSWSDPVIGNNDGIWDPEMDCSETGFRIVTGREDGWPGIVNVRAFCLNTETEITSNNDMRGEYNPDLECRLTGQQAVGVQVNKETHHGINNFRILCA